MIRSQRELNVTKRRHADFDDAVAAFDLATPPKGVQASAHRAAYDALVGLRDELAKEIQQYERLRTEGVTAVRIAKVADLPAALIQGRIARRLSQGELAERLGVKPQQIQRWEREDYANAQFSSMLDVANALGIAGCLQTTSHQATRPTMAPVQTDFAWTYEGPRPGALFVMHANAAPGKTHKLVGDEGSIELGDDVVRVRGMGGRDGEFRRHQPMKAKAVWQPAPEPRSFRSGDA